MFQVFPQDVKRKRASGANAKVGTSLLKVVVSLTVTHRRVENKCMVVVYKGNREAELLLPVGLFITLLLSVDNEEDNKKGIETVRHSLLKQMYVIYRETEHENKVHIIENGESVGSSFACARTHHPYNDSRERNHPRRHGKGKCQNVPNNDKNEVKHP